MAKVQFTSPVGRMVFGSVWEGSTTDSKGAPRVIKSGPNKGQPSTVWSFGVAFPKRMTDGTENKEFAAFRELILDAGRAGYPQFFNGPTDSTTGKPTLNPAVTFSTKIKDGDGYDTKGQANFEKEGWAGHWIVVFSSQYKPRVFDIKVGLDPVQELQDKSQVLPGDYVAVNGTVDANIGAESAGVYVNANMVCKIEGGPRIVTGPKASEAFKNVMAGQLPPGCVPGTNPANAAPLPPGGAVPSAPGAPSVPAGVVMAPNVTVIAPPVVPHDARAKALADGWIVHPTAPGYMYKGSEVYPDAEVLALYPAPTVPVVPPAPAVPTAPVVPPAPTVPVVPPAPAVPSGPTLTATALAAGFTTYDAAVANGWNDALLRQHGYIA